MPFRGVMSRRCCAKNRRSSTLARNRGLRGQREGLPGLFVSFSCQFQLAVVRVSG